MLVMRAIVQSGYGSPEAVLELKHLDVPAIADDEVLVEVRATSVHPDVWHAVRGVPHVMRLMGAGLRRPKHPVPGIDLAGEVHAVGADVSGIEPGDEVFGEIVRGIQWRNGGSFAEYAAVPYDLLAAKPGNISFEEAAAVPTPGIIALQNLRFEGGLTSGQRVLVNGAGGGVGVYAVQLAKVYGADVTGVDSADKLDMVRSLGADRVIDYAAEDFTRTGDRYDLILDVPGNHSFAECRRALTRDGSYVLIAHDGFGSTAGRWLGSLPHGLALVARSPFVGQLPSPTASRPDKRESMAILASLLEAGEIAPVIDSMYPLADVAAAIGHLERGDAKGRIVITM